MRINYNHAENLLGHLAGSPPRFIRENEKIDIKIPTKKKRVDWVVVAVEETRATST